MSKQQIQHKLYWTFDRQTGNCWFCLYWWNWWPCM